MKKSVKQRIRDEQGEIVAIEFSDGSIVAIADRK